MQGTGLTLVDGKALALLQGWSSSITGDSS
jgi:hypothetical protein